MLRPSQKARLQRINVAQRTSPPLVEGVDIITAETNEDSPEEDVLPAGWRANMNLKSGKRDHASSVGGGEYNLVGLIGWWRRLEKGEESFWNECRIKQREKASRRSTTLSFIKKCYPSTNVVKDGRVNLTVALNPKKLLTTKNEN